MKNAYAIALGVTDGLEVATGHPHHNHRSPSLLAARPVGRLCGIGADR